MEKYDSEFATGVKKFVWVKVAKDCQHVNDKITAKSCEIKWKSLVRTYKSTLLNNKTSGQKRRYWQYFDVIDTIMHKKPEINPPVTCSTLKGMCTGNIFFQSRT